MTSRYPDTPDVRHALQIKPRPELGTVEVIAEPVPGILPDGIRACVTAVHERDNATREPVPGARVQLLEPESGSSDVDDTAGRIARTPFAAGSWAACRIFGSHARTWNIDGGTFPKKPGAPFDPMPEPAAYRFARIACQIAEHVHEHAPETWTGAELRAAGSALERERAKLEEQRKAVAAAEERYDAAHRANAPARMKAAERSA